MGTSARRFGQPFASRVPGFDWTFPFAAFYFLLLSALASPAGTWCRASALSSQSTQQHRVTTRILPCEHYRDIRWSISKQMHEVRTDVAGSKPLVAILGPVGPMA
jgi:hypothetical protein